MIVMKLIDLLEKDKDSLLTELAAAKTAEKAIRVLENELDKLLMTYNEQCGNERERSAAAHMMQSIRLSLSLIDSNGETRVWETEVSAGSKGRMNPLGFILMAAGLVLCAIGLLPVFTAAMDTMKEMDLFRPIALVLGGLAAEAVGGVLTRRFGKKDPQRRHHAETLIDSNKIYRSFRNAILSVDQNLDEIRAMQRWEKRDEAGLIDGHEVSASELDLFSDLLAASYSEDPEYALEKIAEIRYYLHRQQIEVVDYSEKTVQYFDMMPSLYAGTIRPALVADGKLLRKGIASAGAQ